MYCTTRGVSGTPTPTTAPKLYVIVPVMTFVMVRLSVAVAVAPLPGAENPQMNVALPAVEARVAVGVAAATLPEVAVIEVRHRLKLVAPGGP